MLLHGSIESIPYNRTHFESTIDGLMARSTNLHVPALIETCHHIHVSITHITVKSTASHRDGGCDVDYG